jgi:peroxiredoxin
VEADIKKAGAVVYAISNEEAGDLKRMKEAEKLGDTFVFLSDKQAKVADSYAGHYSGRTVLKPATLVIGKDGKIVYAYVGEDFKVRASAQSVLQALNKLNDKAGK